MTIPTDEQLCEMSQQQLQQLKTIARLQFYHAGKDNRWKLHQSIGDLLCKLDQLINQ